MAGKETAPGQNSRDSSDCGNEASTSKTPDKILVWLGPEQRAVPRSQITNDLITTLRVMCTACGEQVNHFDPKKVLIHKHLKVILCRNCYKRYGDGHFQKDSSGADEYCRWCAEGGSLVVCDSCSRSFCKSCIRRNLSRKELGRITSLDVWSCYVCDASPIQGLVNYADMIREFSKKQQQRPSNQLVPSSDSPGGKVSEEVQLKMIAETTSQIQRALDEFNKAKEGKGANPEDLMKTAELMHANALRLARITEGVDRSQRRKKKLQRTDRTSTADKKRTSKKAEDKRKGKMEEDGQGRRRCVRTRGSLLQADETPTIVLDLPEALSLGDEFPPVAGADCEDSLVESQSLLADLIEQDFPDESGPRATPVVAELSPSHDEASASRNPATADESASDVGGAKTQDLCDRDTDGSASSSEGDNLRDLPTESNKSSSEENEPLTAQTSDKQRKKRSPLSKNQKARQALMRSLRYSEDGSSDEDSEDDLPLALRSRRNEKTPTRRRTKWSPKKKVQEADVDPPTPAHSRSSTPTPVKGEEPGPDDPKLSLVPVVVLRKLHIPLDTLTEGEKRKSEDDISGLLRFPQPARKRNRTPRKPGEAKAVVKKSKKADAEGIEASDDGEVEPKKKQKAVPNKKEDVVPDCEEEEAASEKEEAEAAPEKEEDKEEAVPDGDEEDSDEIGVATKKSKKLLKYEKLLQKPIPSGKVDSSENEEPPESRKRKPKSKRVAVSSEDEDKHADSKKPEVASSSSLGSSSSSESDDSDIQPARKKKKKQASSSKGSSGRSDDSDFKPSKKGKRGRRDASASPDSGKANKKKRRRIKVAASSEDDKENSDDSVEILNSSQEAGNKSRKNLRKLRPVGDETRAAAKAEEERKKRVQERQKLFNEIRGGAPECGNTTLEELVLEMDLKTKEPLVTVDQKLVKCMKPHQVDGVKFMYDCTIESLEMLKKDPKKGSGCILAHCMGLGKTFQVISFLHTVLNHKECGKIVRTALIVCPYNTVLNWAQEFERWLEDKGLDLTVHEMSSIKDNHSRVEILEYWQKKGGAMIIGYDMFRRLTNEKAKGVSKKLKERLRKALLDPGPDIVACDEGHILKSDKTGLSIAMNSLRTGRRIVLTGTPLQNNLQECEFSVKFGREGSEFTNRFVNPIANGQCADSTALDVRLMKKRVHILHRLLNGCVQRCDYNALKPFLPPKCEYVISVRLSEVQVQLYRHFLDHLARGGRNSKPTQGMSLFWDFNMLRNIWTHPMLLVMSAERTTAKELLKYDSSDSMASFIDDGSKSSSSKSDSEEEVVCLDKDKPSTSKGRKRDVKVDRVGDRSVVSLSAALGEDSEEEKAPSPQSKEWWDQYVSEEDMEKFEVSGKMSLLYNILQECDAIGDKLLLFSQSLLTLNMVEKLLEQCDERASAAQPDATGEDPSDPLQDCHNTWVSGIDYFRMDGSTSVELRKRWIEMFNDESNPRGRLFLISTRAGSLGTNLVGANRVVLMDASWNPTHDVQAIFRVYRFGQKKPVFIYRLLAQGTMEEKIYDRQVTKQSLACRVVDEQQIERHFNAADLMELYSFSPDSKSNRPTPMVPKDRLLAEMLMKHQHWIVSYHEHDSLLQNVVEEDLTEEERKLAWEEFKDEGRRAASDAEELLRNNNASGQQQYFSLDLHKLISDIRAKASAAERSALDANPTMTEAELSRQLQTTLLTYQGYFKKQQMDAFEKRAEYLRLKQLVPPHILNQLTQAGVALQQLNQVLTKLQTLVLNTSQSYFSVRAGT
ncbi:hypothetical protein HPB47_024584 [Ixodes persulcatus]|uniref:Uncharacterized protein n=1 Tax=Ixodes persulcatus TaxID=34615 RepID=A0AC60Q6N5_IXOPE|nr:hypothetical protein HPB47_024584 [Ixodes persulcatus]